MALVILTNPDDFPAIRAAVDTSLRENDLPDSIIGLNIYAWAAEQDVLELDPNAATRIGDDAIHIRNAAIFFCAARLCPVVVRLTSINVQARDLSYTRPAFDPTKRAEELREMAADQIAEVLEPTAEAANRPTMFGRAAGYRGR